MIDIAKQNADTTATTTTTKNSNGNAKRNGNGQVRSRPARAAVIADQTGVPIEYLRKVLQRLTHARLVVSERGRTGGFRLARPAHKIQLLQIFEAIEGPIDEMAFLGDGLLDGRAGKTYPQLKRWRRDASERLREIFGETTLNELLGTK